MTISKELAGELLKGCQRLRSTLVATALMKELENQKLIERLFAKLLTGFGSKVSFNSMDIPTTCRA